jgi:protein phosphatase PTC6
VLCTNGITDVISDQEIIDIAKFQDKPLDAAKEIIEFSDQLGAEDNASCFVIRLSDPETKGLPDLTKDLRACRLREAQRALGPLKR